MRNELVHHFLERFDLWSVAGCQNADLYLDAGMAKVDNRYAELRHWALTMAKAQRTMAAFMETPEYKELLFGGTAPDGTAD